MARALQTVIALSCLAVAVPTYAGGWVDFTDETATRMPADFNDPATSTADTQEKDYAWGDVDNDGDIDLVCVRKQPFTSTGKRTNVLFMNEGVAEGHSLNGVFADRTAAFATASDVVGDQGFLTATNDRDVALVDVNNDGWLDIVTATTLTDNQAKNLSHPRVYMNLGEDGGNWLGFRYEDQRIPDMHSPAGRFCSVAAGDVNGDGFADLYFGDYDSGGSQLYDYNNKLLINDGNGFFSDQSDARLTFQMRESAFGAASAIEDINDDGVLDVVKQTSLQSPTHVAVTYNNPGNEGVFSGYDTVYSLAPYFISVGDLNGDGRLDIVVVDDGTDRYMLNTGNGGDGQANWNTLTFPSASNGFGGNAVIADLNNDDHNDVLITDVDVDISGCARRMHIYRNLGNVPNVTFQEQGQVIPNGLLNGTHDVAVFDINDDGWLDLVVGRCSDTRIWMNDPPVGMTFTYPQGLPAFITPDAEFEFQVQATAIGGSVEPASGRIHISVDGQPFSDSAMTPLGGDLYTATLPAVDCTNRIEFYMSAELAKGGGIFTDPPTAPGSYFTAIGAEGVDISLRDEIEGDVSEWQISSVNLTNGEWEQADPNGTIDGASFAAPDNDATAGAENVQAFVTMNGEPDGPANLTDVDGGPTYLASPLVDLAGTDATISYSRWFYCDDEGFAGADFLSVEVSNDDGQSWTPIQSQVTGGTDSAWEESSFVVGDFVMPTAEVRVRFVASDQPNNSITEAGIDNFQVEEFVCGDQTCAGDIDGNLEVNFQDLLALLAQWGPCPGCAADFDGNDEVDFNDLLGLLAAWGRLPVTDAGSLLIL